MELLPVRTDSELTLRGYDPELDYQVMTREAVGIASKSSPAAVCFFLSPHCISRMVEDVLVRTRWNTECCPKWITEGKATMTSIDASTKHDGTCWQVAHRSQATDVGDGSFQ
jgi:hypothetical protein